MENFRAFFDFFWQTSTKSSRKTCPGLFFSFYGVVIKEHKKVHGQELKWIFLMGNPTVTTRKSPEKLECGQWTVVSFFASIGGRKSFDQLPPKHAFTRKPGHIFRIFWWWGFCKTNSDNFYVRPSSWVRKRASSRPFTFGKKQRGHGMISSGQRKSPGFRCNFVYDQLILKFLKFTYIYIYRS